MSPVKNLISFAFLATLAFSGFVHAEDKQGFDHSHGLWSQVLSKYLSQQGAASRVDYENLKKDSANLYTYLKQIEAVSESEFKSFNREQQIAFLLNYYNAHQVQQVIENYPLKSVRDLGFLLYTPWKIDFFTIFGKEANLDYIGHDLLEPYKEPRIHFALNCASIGCPALYKEAYQGDKLEEQFEAASTLFLNEKSFNYYDKKKNRLHLSSIFKWYDKDFGSEKDLHAFIAKYMKAYDLNGKQASIKHLDYDWNLNDVKAGF